MYRTQGESVPRKLQELLLYRPYAVADKLAIGALTRSRLLAHGFSANLVLAGLANSAL
jgi:hypothetical protein